MRATRLVPIRTRGSFGPGPGVVMMTVAAGSVLGACISLSGLTNGPIPDAGPEQDAQYAPSAPLDASANPDPDDAADTRVPRTRADAYRAAVLADSPLAYWRFEETTGTLAKDDKGAHPGTYVFSPTLGSPGIFDATRAVVLPVDSNAHVEIPGSDFAFGGNAPYTFEAWVKPAEFTNLQMIASTETSPPRLGWSVLAFGTGEVGYEVWLPSDGGAFNVRNLTTNQNLALGRFQHVVITYNGSVMKGYLEGTLANSLPGPKEAPDSGTLLLGCRKTSQQLANCLDGWSLDEVAIYDHPLTDARIRAHYELGHSP